MPPYRFNALPNPNETLRKTASTARITYNVSKRGLRILSLDLATVRLGVKEECRHVPLWLAGILPLLLPPLALGDGRYNLLFRLLFRTGRVAIGFFFAAHDDDVLGKERN